MEFEDGLSKSVKSHSLQKVACDYMQSLVNFILFSNGRRLWFKRKFIFDVLLHRSISQQLTSQFHAKTYFDSEETLKFSLLSIYLRIFSCAKLHRN